MIVVFLNFHTHMQTDKILFQTFLETAFENGNYATDDVIAFVLPLFQEVIGFHEVGAVAPFDNPSSLFITENRLDIDEALAHSPSYNKEKLQAMFAIFASKHFDIVGKTQMETDVDLGTQDFKNLNVHVENKQPELPAFVIGYDCFEMRVGHHTAQSDIFCLGLILGGISLGLDLYDVEDVKMFAMYRKNPVQYNSRIHPTLSSLITEMTELDATKRTQDLYDVVHRLQHYRNFDPEKQTDLSRVAGWVNKELKERSQFILNKLRNRLFDTSRRNRLLFYKSNMRFVNLTVSSVPMVLHHQSIRPDLLFTWSKEISTKVIDMKEIVLNTYLRFEDHTYLPSALDKIRVESQRNVQEYGFSQLKLVIAFLNWHNLKEDQRERIQSPLLLIPVELKKTKRLKEDHYVMKVLDNVAEVNPVLANQLRDLYGIKLPDIVDLEEMKMEQFFQLLKVQIDTANQGIKLQFVEKPKIKLVHSVAKQTVTNYKKRIRRTGYAIESYKNIAYSYQTEHYKPLGLEIFKQRIESRSAFLEFLINEDVQIASKQLTGDIIKERALFEMSESESNPYSWDFDVCNIVLGNFNYKKMSLVRDYNQIIDHQIQHAVFESLFSDQPKQIKAHDTNIHDVDLWNHVITADPTQTKAILQSRTGESYIIQGPPGTGKSQTITNLIADLVASGKSVLFVCEKRAALDVVYHRLKQNGLDELCCYIHDSQGDKRAFIKNLKSTYEDFAKNKMSLEEVSNRRKSVVQKLKEQLQVLQAFHEMHLNENTEAGIPIINLIERLIVLRKEIMPLSAKQQEFLPSYKSWIQFGDVVKELSKALEEVGADAAFADHPFCNVNEAVYMTDNPLNSIDELILQSQKLLAEVKSTIAQFKIDDQHSQYLSQVKNLVQDSVLLHPLAENDNLKLVDMKNTQAREFDQKVKLYHQLQKKEDISAQQNVNWQNKLSQQDVLSAIAIAEKSENSFFGFLNGKWRRLKKQLQQSYDFTKHQIKPAYTQVLKNLEAEYCAIQETQSFKNNLQEMYGIENLDTACIGIEVVRNKQGDKEIDYLLAHTDANNIVKSLYKANGTLLALEAQLRQCLFTFESKSLNALTDELETLAMNVDGLKDLLPALKHFASLPTPLKLALRTIPMTALQAEANMANKSMLDLQQEKKVFANTDALSIAKVVQQIHQSYEQLLQLNAANIRACIRNQFLQNVELSNTALSQLSPTQKVFKKEYNEGRKILENEFGKSMRFKSIRELSAKESKLVLKDIKPIWLMSPLSVSDSLPLDTQFFDAVIFDEASQITLEEGIPSLYRSPQTIIVGDDKQMPPTNFFTAKAEDPDDLESFGENAADELLSADADSLLVQGVRKLDSTMLSWHYRSRYETLISYSNHAFYGADLLTIPDKTIHHVERPAIEVAGALDAKVFADCLFDRSISFHFHPNSIYEKRNNLDEATYIAHLVRELLMRKVNDTIGIVAFSQEQQHTIEDALTALAETDKAFEFLLEEAYNRTDKDQFVGLIIKNLENIQGDERDIIIMSVCYGFDARKKILMNFGPINKKGGEKRLNVIFSRAKKHMAIVSSIKHNHITNEYNEGANYFRRFLQYAENVSKGNMQTARTILDGLVLNKTTNKKTEQNSIVLREVKLKLTQLGFFVDAHIGQSDFKCSLGVKKNAESEVYALGILIDDEKHYSNENLLEQYYQRPAILKSFGWRCMHVFAKDWLQNEEKVMTQILNYINEEPKALVENENIAEIKIVEFDNEIKIVKELDAAKELPSVIGFENLQFVQYIFADVSSNKFWEVAVQENKLIIRFGRKGSKGQVQIKTFVDAEMALVEKTKMEKEKLGKGYKLA